MTNSQLNAAERSRRAVEGRWSSARDTRRWLAYLTAGVGVAAAWLATRSPYAHDLLWGRYRVSAVLLNLALTGAAAAALYLCFGAGERRQRLFTVVATAGSLLLGLALVEMPVILFGHDYSDTFGLVAPTLRARLEAGIFKPDPELIYTHWPSPTAADGHKRPVSRAVRELAQGDLVRFGIPASPDYAVDYFYDGNGFRNEFFPLHADVVAIGDAFVEGVRVQPPDIVTRQIAARLGAGRVVANLGHSGYGPYRELIVLKRYAPSLKPQLVLWFFAGRDDLRDIEVYAAERRALERPTRSRPLRQRLFVRNALVALARRTTPPLVTPAPAAYARSATFTLASGSADTVYFGGPNAPWTPAQWQTAVALLAEAHAYTRDHLGADFLLVYVPPKFDVYQPYVTFPADGLARRWQATDLPEQLGAWATGQGIDYVDTTPVLRDLVARGEHVYLRDDSHWNERGHRAAAEAVVAFLKSRGSALAP